LLSRRKGAASDWQLVYSAVDVC